MKPEMSVLGIDMAKRVFHAVGMDERGKIVLRERLSRHDLMPFLAKLPSVLLGMDIFLTPIKSLGNKSSTRH